MLKNKLKEPNIFFNRYVLLVEEDDLKNAFSNQFDEICIFLKKITEEKSNFKYAENKWTLKEILQHIIDAERILSYRALCIARGEKQDLPGFEEDFYAANSFANDRKWSDLIEDFIELRKSTQKLFLSFTESVLSIIGTANSNSITPIELGFSIIGHFKHHQKVMVEKYLK